MKVNGVDQAFTFGIINVEGDYETLSLELGEECGQADITKCDAEEFVDAIHEFDTEHKLIR